MIDKAHDSRSAASREVAHRALERRSVLKAAAWTAPAVAVAVALPAAAASVERKDVDLGVTFRGTERDLFGDIINGIEAWYNGLATWQKLAVAAPYGALWAALTVQGNLFNAAWAFPSHAVVSNIDSIPVQPVQNALVSLDFGSAVFNLGAFDAIANIEAFGTGSGANISVHAVAPTAPGGVVTEIPLTYNPITLQVNLAGGSQNPGTASALLTGDTRVDGNYAETGFGLRLEVFAGFAPLFEAVNSIIPIPPITIKLFA